MLFNFDLGQTPIIFAFDPGEALGTAFLVFLFFFGFIAHLLKRMDKGGAMKRAGRQAARRGAWTLFNHLTKR